MFWILFVEERPNDAILKVLFNWEIRLEVEYPEQNTVLFGEPRRNTAYIAILP